MNGQLLSFCQFLLWLTVCVVSLTVGPWLYPRAFAQMPFLPAGAGAMAVWNLAKWWNIRQRARQWAYGKDLEVEYRKQTGKPLVDEEKPVVNPAFQFGDTPNRIPPAPPPNGTSH